MMIDNQLIKLSSLFVFVVFSVAGIISPQKSHSAKIGFVNSSRVQKNSQSFQRKIKSLEKIKARLLQQIVKQRQNLQNNRNSHFPDSSRDERQKIIARRANLKKQINYLELRKRRLKKKIKQFEDDIYLSLMKKIRTIGSILMKLNNLDILVIQNPSHNNQSQTILTKESALDLTESVITRLKTDNFSSISQ